jgi:hypothetical protein
LIVDLQRPARPGFYQLRRGTTRLATAAINIDPREGDLRRVDQKALSRHLDKEGGGTAAGSAMESNSLPPPGGQPLWGHCLAAAMGFIAIELLLIGVWRR